MPRWTPLVTLLLGVGIGLGTGAWLFRSPAPPVNPGGSSGAAAAPAVETPSPVSPVAPPAKTGEAAKPTAKTTPATRDDSAHRLTAELAEKQQQLTASEQSLADAKAKIEMLGEQVASLNTQFGSAQKREKELASEAAELQRQLQTAEAAAKTREARIADLDQAVQRTQKQLAELQQKQPQQQRLATAATDLEELARRREVYVNNILGRYREATDLFRAMSLRLDNPRDAGNPLNNDLARIQTAIQSADEDLRQLRALNAQSAKLQKELAARK